MNGPFAIPVPQIRCIWAMGIGDKGEPQGSSVVVCFKYRTPHRPYATGPSSVSASGVEPEVPLSRQPGAQLGPETWLMAVLVTSPG